MEPNRKSSDQPETAEQLKKAAPRKRFRIENLEERIAPKKKTGGSSNSGSSGGWGVTTVF